MTSIPITRAFRLAAQRRMQVFDSAGGWARAVVLELPPGMHPLTYPQITGRFAGGFLAFLTPHFEPGQTGVVRRDSLEFIRYGAAGEFVERIAPLPGFDRTPRRSCGPVSEHRSAATRDELDVERVALFPLHGRVTGRSPPR